MPRPSDPPAGDIDRRARRSALALLAIVSAIAVLGGRAPPSPGALSAFLLFRQDIWFVAPLALALLIRARGGRAFAVTLRWPAVMALALVLLLACWAGHYLVMDGRDFSRDEQMADFDAAILSHGRLFWPIAPAWRGFAEALNQTFILPIGDREAWVSAYLPGNAACRALIGLVADPALTAPLFVAMGALALWRIALRLWPDSPATRLVALALYAGSSQVVVAGMTAYAMSAHLGLDLVWLMLFLRGGRAGHGGAMLVGLLATGLHQPLFHPLFVLPFLDLLWRRRRWRLLALYVAAYAAIGLFWLAWPLWIGAHATTLAPGGGAAIGYGRRLIETVHRIDGAAIWLMAANLLRFAAWQHLLLLPLLALGIATGWRGDPVARALALGLMLPVAAMALLLPYQGHGWGYRYVHGVIGNACLLGGFGWRWLEARGASPYRAMAAATIASIAVALPVHALMAHAMVTPFAQADAAIAATDADLAIVDDAAAPFVQDLVLNRPDLANRPLRLKGSALTPAQLAGLCRGRSIAFVDAPALAPIDRLFGAAPPPGEAQAALHRAARAAGCTVRPFSGFQAGAAR